MSQARCDNCRFWFEPMSENSSGDKMHPDDYTAECRRYPPTRSLDISPDQRDALMWPADAFEFPMSAASAWCGEYQAFGPSDGETRPGKD